MAIRTKGAPDFRLADWLLFPGLAGCGLAVLLPLFRDRHWVFALFENAPLQVGLALLVLLLAGLVLRRRRAALLAVVLLLPVLGKLSYYLIPQPYPDETRDLRTVSFNVRTANPHRGEVLDFLRSADADVIALVEVSEEWLADLSPLLETHPHTAHYPARHNFGMGLFSKHPVLKFVQRMPTPGHPLLLVDLDHHGSLLTVMVAHPVPPVSARAHDYRTRYLRSCAEEARARRGPALLVGDFNTTPWSPLFTGLLETGRLQDSGRGRGYQATWQRRNPLFALPLDHVLHSGELTPVARRIGPPCGSDHSPVVVDFRFTPTVPAQGPPTVAPGGPPGSP